MKGPSLTWHGDNEYQCGVYGKFSYYVKRHSTLVVPRRYIWRVIMRDGNATFRVSGFEHNITAAKMAVRRNLKEPPTFVVNGCLYKAFSIHDIDNAAIAIAIKSATIDGDGELGDEIVLLGSGWARWTLSPAHPKPLLADTHRWCYMRRIL